MGHVTISLLASLLSVMLWSTVLVAGNGKLSGRVYDAQTGNPICGIVQIAHTPYGCASDSSGRFYILGIVPGTYDVRCSAVGYRSQLLSGLVIAPENLHVRDFALRSAGVDLEEVVILADRVTMESSETSARTDFDGDEFEKLPVNSAMDLIALSPGTFKQFLGGVLPVFSRTEIDGIDVTDETALWYAELLNLVPSGINGGRSIAGAQRSSFAEPNMMAVGQATLLTGTSGPDHAGGAGSLRYALREGQGVWKGEASVRVSQLGGLHHLGPNVYADALEYVTQHANLAASKYADDRQMAEYYTWTPEKYSYGKRPDITASVAMGGSLADGVGLYLTGSWHSLPDRLPNEKTQLFDGSLKFTWGLSPTTRLSIVGLLEDRGRLFGWKNSSYSDSYRYFLEGVPRWDGVQCTGGAKLSLFLSQATTVDLQVSIVYDGLRRGFCDDNNDGIVSPWEQGDFLTWSDTSQVNRYQAAPGDGNYKKFFGSGLVADGSLTRLLSSAYSWKVARPPIYYENSTSQVVTVKGDVSSQIQQHHLLEYGAQLRLHTVAREMRTGAYALGVRGYKSYIEEIWTRNPADASVYLQDRMQLAGLVLNIGLRLEGTRIDAAPVVNWYAAPDTIADEQGGPELAIRRGAPLPWQWFLSPRVSFSHPIGASAAVHASFSRTRISLPYSYLYANYNTVWNTTLLSLVPIVNLDCEPIAALKYEFGAQWMVGHGTLIGVNAYYHTYANMEQRYASPTLIRVIPNSPLPQYYAVTNAFDVDTRGIEVSLRQDRTPLMFGIFAEGRIAYAYSHIDAASLVPSNRMVYSAATGDSTAFDGRIPFSDIAMWDRSMIESSGGGSSLIAGFNRTHRITCAVSFEVPWGIRVSGTGMFSSGFWYPEKLRSDRTVPYATGPWNRRVDIRLEKQWPIAEGVRVDLFVDIMNAFNWTNILTYVNAVETAQFAWETDGDPTGGVTVNRPVAGESAFIYDIPREVYLGVRIGF